MASTMLPLKLTGPWELLFDFAPYSAMLCFITLGILLDSEYCHNRSACTNTSNT